ncbi:response regulator transcription factor [Lysinibacillus xylanilyticus]|uniref:response regulator transcription factor n=1 Tax=Lysinibacillus xylanilyticus TaxID=582475 RepID=UPI0037F77E71
MTSLLIVDDHPIVLEGTKNLFQGINDIEVEIESDVAKILKRISNHPFDVYLIDINMPLNGITLSQQIKALQPTATIILYTGNNVSDYYPLLLEKKVEGILSKTASKEKIIRTIYSAINKEMVLSLDFLDFLNNMFELQTMKYNLQLTEKEKKILKLITDGYTNRGIAVELKVTQRTVERYLSQLFALLNVEGRADAIMFVKKHNLL